MITVAYVRELMRDDRYRRVTATGRN